MTHGLGRCTCSVVAHKCTSCINILYSDMHLLQNGSLDDALHGRRPSLAAAPVHLDWVSRTRIAAEAASALTHLHALRQGGVAHGGLRPACILLDRDCSARLGDAAIHAIFSQPEVPPQTPIALVLQGCALVWLMRHMTASSALATLHRIP